MNNGVNNGVNNDVNNGVNNGVNNDVNNGENNGENNGVNNGAEGDGFCVGTGDPGEGDVCDSSADCSGSLECHSAAGCVLRCGSDAHCGDGACIFVCRSNVECDRDEACVDGNCVSVEAECETDLDCDDEEFICEDGQCVAEGNGPVYRFLLVEDLSTPVSGEYPGADLDTVELIKGNGRIHYPSALEDFNIRGDNNLASDPTQLLGPPDADCQADSGRFVSLGGQAAGAYVILSYGTFDEDVTLNNGDSLRVYELGATLCGEFDDDSVALSVSVGNTLGSFAELGVDLGEAGTGAYEIPVTGL